MAEFVPKNPSELSGNVFEEIGTRWMLLTAWDRQNGRVNAMTASWGGMGVLWNRPVLFAFVRPQRHTRGLLDEGEVCSACFLEDGHREILKLCGTRSGRDTDKIAAAGLTPVEISGAWGFAEASRVLKLRKLFVADMEEQHFVDPALLSNYAAGDYHRVYVFEIESAYEKI